MIKFCKKHDKVYSTMAMSLTSFPPIYVSSWICKICGAEGSQSQQDNSLSEYDEIKSKFGKNGNITGTSTNGTQTFR